MSFSTLVNFTKGWPCPSIVDHITGANTGVIIAEGMIGTIDPSTGLWKLGVIDTNLPGYVFRNGPGTYTATGAAAAGASLDAGQVFVVANSSQQVNYGNIQGIALLNQIEFTTAWYGGNDVGSSDATPTPGVGDQLYADIDGRLKVGKTAGGSVTAGVSGKIVVGIVKVAPHAGTGFQPATLITVLPDNTKRVIA